MSDERIEALARAIYTNVALWNTDGIIVLPELAAWVQARIDEAVAQEREACAGIAESYGNDPKLAWPGSFGDVAAAIRARKPSTDDAARRLLSRVPPPPDEKPLPEPTAQPVIP